MPRPEATVSTAEHFDINALLSAQHPGTDLGDPSKYELLAPALHSDEIVPLSLRRGAEAIAGLKRLEEGEVNLDQIVAVFIDTDDV